MKKKIILVIVGILAILLVLFVFGLESIKNNQSSLVVPTPIQVTPAIKNGVSIVSTNPKDLATDISLDHSISVTFNKPISPKEIAVQIIPSSKFSTGGAGSSLIITHEKLLPNVRYTIFLTPQNQLPLSFSFSTVQDTSQSGIDVGAATELELTRKLHPDSYVAGGTPYTQGAFSITSTYVDQPPHYAFTVHAPGIPARNDFILWLKSLGLTDAQISTLDITYQ